MFKLMVDMLTELNDRIAVLDREIAGVPARMRRRGG
jgi:uncharacterized small protein (DUF1192 family)